MWVSSLRSMTFRRPSNLSLLQQSALRSVVLLVVVLVMSACSSTNRLSAGDPEIIGSASPDASVAGVVETLEDQQQDGALAADSTGDVPESSSSAAETVAADSPPTTTTTAVAAAETEASESDAADESAADSPVVTIEPPRDVPDAAPTPATGCVGAGIGSSGERLTTRVGVLVPDYRPLINTGFVPRVTPAEYQSRYLASSLGANLRSQAAVAGSSTALPCGDIELVVETYDPIDPRTQREACIALAEDPGVLVVVTELEDRRGEALSCLLDEAGIPVVTAGGVTSDDLEEANGRLISLRPPVDLLGTSAVRSFANLGLLADQKIAVVGGDGIVAAAASQAVLDELANLGFDEVLSVTLPDSEGVTEAWSAIPDKVAEMVDDEVTVVISVFDPLINNALWDRMTDQNARWQWLLVDAQGSGEHDKVSRLPDEFSGLLVTSLESSKDAVRDDPASRECIDDYALLVSSLETNPAEDGLVAGDPASPAFVLPAGAADEAGGSAVAPQTSIAPDGEIVDVDDALTENADDNIETALREVFGEERPPGPACALMTVVIKAIMAAGSDLNSESIVDAFTQTGPLDLFIEGTGSLTSTKHYVADFVHVLGFVRFEKPISEELVAPCDSPDNCWRQVTDDAARLRLLTAEAETRAPEPTTSALETDGE